MIGMMPGIVKIIEKNLINVDEDHLKETLLPDEKCKYCGKEIFSSRDARSGICARCKAENRRTKKNRCNIHRGLVYRKAVLSRQDPEFDKGKGEVFFRAFQRALLRGDFK